LPLAHTEAPTAGSVILAGVLLKLGTYGFLRFAVPILPDATLALAAPAATVCIVGIIYGALVAWVQKDIKKLVAYSSVSHLGFCMLGLFSLRPSGVVGSVMYMLNHGLSTGALFLVVGMIYERYHTREIARLGGLARRMPWLSFFLIFFTLSSIALPGLNGFVSEFLVLLGTFTSNQQMAALPAGPLSWHYAAFAATGVILSALYLLWMCQRVLFGPLKEPPNTPDTSKGLKPDLTRREIALLAPIAAACLWIGVYPYPLMRTIYPAVTTQVLEHVYPPPRLIAQESLDAESPAADSLESPVIVAQSTEP
jgi:NADH-quinone oxidoreductase subunit M